MVDAIQPKAAPGAAVPARSPARGRTAPKKAPPPAPPPAKGPRKGARAQTPPAAAVPVPANGSRRWTQAQAQTPPSSAAPPAARTPAAAHTPKPAATRSQTPPAAPVDAGGPGFLERTRDAVKDGAGAAWELPGKAWEATTDAVRDSWENQYVPAARGTADYLGKGFEPVPDALGKTARGTADFLKELPGEILDYPVDFLKGVGLLKERPGHVPLDPGLQEVEGSPGLLYRPGDAPPTAAGLDGGFYASAGVEDAGGNVRGYITYPSLKATQGTTDYAEVGDEVEVGDILFRIKDDDLDRDIRNARAKVASTTDVLGPILNEAQGRRGEIDRPIAQKRRQVAAQEVVVVQRADTASRFESLEGTGAVSVVRVNEARAEVAGAREELGELRVELAELEARQQVYEDLSTLTPENLIARVEDGDAARLPPEVVGRASEVLAARADLAGLLVKKESLNIRSTIAGTVSQQIPEGRKNQMLDGSLELASSTEFDLGVAALDPERITPSDGNDGSVTTVVPHDYAVAKIQFTGVSATQSKDFQEGSRVAFITSNGSKGTAEVETLVPYTGAAGYKVILRDATLDDGGKLTAGAREPLLVYGSETPTTERERASSDTVTFSEASAPVTRPLDLREAEQDFHTTIPIYATDGDGSDAGVVAWLDVSGRVSSDRRGVEVLSSKATMRTLDGTAIPYDADIEVEANNAGSATADSPRKESGARLRVSVPIIADNATLTSGGALDVRFGADLGATASGSWNRSRASTELQDAQQFQLPIDIVPTGRLDGRIAQITTPAAIRATVGGDAN